MKNTIIILCLLLLVASCSTSRYELTGNGQERYFLQKRIDESVAVGMISKTPLLVVDGKTYRYNVELKKQKLDLSGKDITQIDILKWDKAMSIFGEEGKMGVMLITTSASRAAKGVSTDGNVLVLLEGNKISFEDLKKIDPIDIESIDIIKTKEQIQNFTWEAYDGVIVIKLKQKKE